jgi:hypothetical protein
MGLIQTGSTLYSDGTSSGLTQLVYSCDGCDAITGDPYAKIAFVLRTSDHHWDTSEVEGWTFLPDDEDGDSSRCYCADCVRAERHKGQIQKDLAEPHKGIAGGGFVPEEPPAA